MLSDNDLSQFIMRVLNLASKYDLCSVIWWRTDGKYAPITFFVNCNDLFYWACADTEEITPENIDSLEQAIIDLGAICKHGEVYGVELWCSRMRHMRPQGAFYPHDKELWLLFDECGPEREVGFGNPCVPGEYRQYLPNG